MNQKRRYILGLLILLFFTYFGYFLFITLIYQHHNNYNSFKKYLWILNDSIKKDVDSIFFVGLERESDNLYEYIIENQNAKHFISICHLKNIDTIDLCSVEFIEGFSFENLKIYSAEKFNLESKVRPEITIKSKLPFNNSLQVNLNHNSEIIKMIDSKNIKGFFGNINKMSISNRKGKHLIFFDYGNRKQQSLFLFYERYHNLFFILINSDRPINESILNILNLTS